MTSSSSLYGTVTQQNTSSANSTGLYGDANTPIPDASGNLVVRGDLYVLSGNILTTATTGNIFPTNATTLNIGGAATAVNIGAGTGTTTVNNNLVVDGSVTAEGADFGNITIGVADDNTITTTTGELRLSSTSTAIKLPGIASIYTDNTSSFGVLNQPTTVNAFLGATTLNIGGSSGTTNVNNNLLVEGTGNFTGDITTTGGTLGNITVGVDTNNTITTTSGQLILKSATGEIDTDTTSILSTNSASFFLLNSPTTVNAFQGATTALSIGPNTGTTNINNTLEIDDNLIINGTTVSLAQATTFTYDENNDRLNRPEVQSTTGNSSGFRVVAPNSGTSAASTLSVGNSSDAANTEFLSIQSRGSAFSDTFRVFTGEYTASVLGATGKSISFTDYTNTYATVNPAGPTIGTDLTTKAYVDALPANITYTIDSSSTTGGANFNLVGSDATTDTIKFANGTNVTVTATDANTITIAATDTNTTYTIDATSTTGGANLNLTGSDASTDTVAYLGSGATTVSRTDANTITISSTDNNTTYTQDVTSTTGGANLNLVGSDATTDSVKFAGGTNVTVVATDASTMTINATDTNTTYDFAATSTTGGANLNLTGSDATTDTVKLSNGGHVTATYTSATEVTLGSDATSANTADTIVARDVSGNFVASGATLGNVTVGVDTDQAVSTTAGNLVLQTAAGVSAGTVTLTAGANGDIIVAPNGTGNVTTTFSNGGNISNNRNYVFGAIRNATTDTTNGDIWELNTSGAQGAANPYFRGVSLDNSGDTTRGPANLLRSYSGGAVSGSAQRGRLIFEKARGTAASPTAVQANDILGSIDVTGYTSTGWLNDTIPAVTGFFGFNAPENWVSNTNLGTAFSLSLAPTATTISTGANLVQTLNINPQTFASRSDAFTWANGKTGTTQTMSLDVSGNLIVTGDVRVNGNDIQCSSGASTITMTSANTATTVRGDQINLQTAASVGITGNKISYNRVFGQWQYDATLTPAAANTAYAVPFQGANATIDFANIATTSSTSQIKPNALGMYKLQFSAQVQNSDNGQDHQVTFWWRKNGTDISNSAGYLTIPKAGAANGALIVGWDNMVEVITITDYYELMYAVSSTSITLPFIAASAPRPGAASVFLTLVPVGA